MSAIEVRMPKSIRYPLDWRNARIEIPDYPTAIALIKLIADAAEAYLTEREERGE